MNGADYRIPRLRKDARRIFRMGVAAVDPAEAVGRLCARHGNILRVDRWDLDLSRYRNVYLVGGGKASAPMAMAMEALLKDRVTGGIVTVKYDHLAPVRRVELVEAGHPVADENGVAGAGRMLDLLHRTGPSDLVFCLISGGGSALMPLPGKTITLADKQRTFQVLTDRGATIHQINTIRKHISRIKGGQMARAAAPSTLITLILSDVVGDELDVIASGPTVPDTSTFEDCRRIIHRLGVRGDLPDNVVRHLDRGLAGRVPETPKPGDPVFEAARSRIVGNNMTAIRAAEAEARRLGYRTLVLSSLIEGETREVARVHGAIGREVLRSGLPIPPPACVLSGGETTVTLRGSGLGGRNQEFALAAAMDIADAGPIVVLCAGTDGTDGPTDAAGAVADSRTVRRALLMGMEPGDHLEHNDAYHFFKPLGDLFITGPTRTNVMDLRLVMVGTDP